MLVLDTGRNTAVWRVEFSPDGTMLVTSTDAEPQVWNVATRQRLILRADATYFWNGTHASFHPSGRWLIGTGIGAGGPLIYDFQMQKKWRERVAHRVTIEAAAFTLEGKAVVYQCRKSDPTRWLDLRAWQPDGKLGHGWSVPLDAHHEWVGGLAVLADGRRVATADLSPSGGARVALRSLADGAVLAEEFFPATASSTLAVAPDDSLVVIQTKNVLRIWPATGLGNAEGREVKNDGRKHFTGIAFHPSGRYLAATSNDATVKLYDTTTWEVSRTFTWDIGKMRSIAFSADGTLAAAGGDAGEVVIWDVDL